MTTQVTIKREVEKLKEKLKPKREDRIVVRMWLPDSDPRHGMTDEELENFEPDSTVIIKPYYGPEKTVMEIEK